MMKHEVPPFCQLVRDILELARELAPSWWYKDGFVEPGVYMLDNFPGQHIRYRKASIELAILLKLLAHRYIPPTSNG